MNRKVRLAVLLMIITPTSLLAGNQDKLLETGKAELVYGIGADNLIYITKVDNDSGYREVLISPDGKYAVTDLRPAIGKIGSTFVLTADFFKNYNEVSNVGKPIVAKEPGALAKIKVFVVTDPRAKNITGERRFITTEEFAALPCSRTGYHYGISTEDELLLVSNSSNDVIILHPKRNGTQDQKPIQINAGTAESSSPTSKMVLVDAKEIHVLAKTQDKMKTIKFDKPFYMDKYEVTNAEYHEFVKATGHATPTSWKGKFPAEKENYPVLTDWAGAKAYAKWAGKKLPSYDQWRAAVTNPEDKMTLWTKEPLMLYHNKYGIPKIAVGTDMYELGNPVGKCEPDKSPYGIYDLLGNVQEWTSTRANLQNLPKGKTAVKLAGYTAQSTNPFGGASVTGDSSAFADYDCYGFRCVSDSDTANPPALAGEIKQERFVVNDTTINDTKTGLVWLKEGFSANDILRSVFPDTKAEESQTLNNGVIKKFLEKIKTAGRKDWRLPTEKDMESLKALIDACNPGRLVLYLTAGDDDTKINAIVLNAHEYIHHNDSQYILFPVSGGNEESKPYPASIPPPSGDALSTVLPKYQEELSGSNEVRIKNPNEFSVLAGIRSAKKGKNLNIPQAIQLQYMFQTANMKFSLFIRINPKPCSREITLR